MRTAATLVAIAINIVVFVSILAFMIEQIDKEKKIPVIATLFFMMAEIGLAIDTVLICTVR